MKDSRKPASQSFRVAVDVGGTFSDLVAVPKRGAGNGVLRAKVPTNARHIEDGVLAALAASGLSANDLATFVHGTTVAINTITQRCGARVGFVTTRGFRDLLLIGRGNRPDLYNLGYRKPPPFVPRNLCFEISERATHDGTVLEPVNEGELDAVSRRLKEEGVAAVVVCFLHAWATPVNETRAVTLLRTALPGVTVMASHAASSQWREYERASTTVLSAYVAPAVSRYLMSLEASLLSGGAAPSMFVMRSNGGVSSFASAARQPITLLESGPAAGVAAATAVGRRVGARHVLTFDMGGTTAKTAAVRDGHVAIRSLHHIEATPRSAGYPVQCPVVDIVEVGAGGGSVAAVDRAGGLHVGPASVGADPGPACYGRDGGLPTVTDANLVAGRLDPAFFLGGSIVLEESAAVDALAHLGSRLGITAEEAARGVLRLGVAIMANALRLVTLQRGHDPRDFAFVAFGGAGALHATLLARELGIRRVVVPPGPGHFSAYGMLETGLRCDAIRTHVGPLDARVVSAALGEAERKARDELGREGADAALRRSLDVRYRGQEHSLEIDVPPGELDDGVIAGLRAALDRRSMEEFGFRLDAAAEVVAVRASATLAEPPLPPPDEAGCGCGGRQPTGRRVDFDQYGGLCDTRVVDRCALSPGETVGGPCVVEETAATTLVLPGQTARCDEHWNLVVEEAS